jgi:hypothetical protein
MGRRVAGRFWITGSRRLAARRAPQSDAKRELTGAQLLARRVRRLAMRATAPLRPWPDAIVIGTGKGGSTSLFDYLAQHPLVARPTRKEVYFFDLHYGRGTSWYRAQFSMKTRRGMRAIEATPNYLSDPRVPARVHELIPNAKFIVLLRDPVGRSVSHWGHLVRDGREQRTLAHLLADEIAEPLDAVEAITGHEDTIRWLRSHVLYHACYARHLERWFERFDRSQFLFLFSDDLFADPVGTTVRVQEFIGLPPEPPTDVAARNTRTSEPDVDPAVRAQMEAFFAPHDAALEALLGIELPWRR